MPVWITSELVLNDKDGMNHNFFLQVESEVVDVVKRAYFCMRRHKARFEGLSPVSLVVNDWFEVISWRSGSQVLDQVDRVFGRFCRFRLNVDCCAMLDQVRSSVHFDRWYCICIIICIGRWTDSSQDNVATRENFVELYEATFVYRNLRAQLKIIAKRGWVIAYIDVAVAKSLRALFLKVESYNE